MAARRPRRSGPSRDGGRAGDDPHPSVMMASLREVRVVAARERGAADEPPCRRCACPDPADRSNRNPRPGAAPLAGRILPRRRAHHALRLTITPHRMPRTAARTPRRRRGASPVARTLLARDAQPAVGARLRDASRRGRTSPSSTWRAHRKQTKEHQQQRAPWPFRRCPGPRAASPSRRSAAPRPMPAREGTCSGRRNGTGSPASARTRRTVDATCALAGPRSRVTSEGRSL